MDIKKRLQNYGLWVAVASFVLLLLQVFDVKVDVGEYDKVVNAGLGLLVLLGILNNPTTKNKGFVDDNLEG